MEERDQGGSLCLGISLLMYTLGRQKLLPLIHTATGLT
jgi:hypothetical protein